MRKNRIPYGTPKKRANLYLSNMELLRQMVGEWNYSAFVDELIAREHRRREKKLTQSPNNSALTAQE